MLQLALLPYGADRDAAVYRLLTADGKPYFVKLRRGFFDEISVALPRFFSEQGIEQIIAPIPTTSGQLWAVLEPFKLILYPYVAGQNGYQVGLTDRQWRDLGATLKRIHTASLPPGLASCIRQEYYSPQWRKMTREFLARAEGGAPADPLAAELVAFLRARKDEIIDLVGRAERLAAAVRERRLDFVLCHSDIHAGNILADANGAFYIVDWDNPILAPKERDLMFIGGGLMGAWIAPQEEEEHFYRGYGRRAQIDPIALAYYRYERITEDIAIFCEDIFLENESPEDREQSLRYLKSNFRPDGVIEIARRTDRV